MKHLVRLSAPLLAVAAILLGSCSSTGSHSLSCDSTEISPSTQPGFPDPKEALDWFLANGGRELPTTGFEETGSSESRRVYSDGTHQISITSLPVEEGAEALWVVTMTYECH